MDSYLAKNEIETHIIPQEWGRKKQNILGGETEMYKVSQVWDQKGEVF